MIKELIKEILEESKQTFDDIDTSVDDVYGQLKGTAKELFMSNKFQQLKDFVFDQPNEENEKIKSKFTDELNKTLEDGDDFISKFRSKVEQKLNENDLKKDLDGLLELFDFSHLKGFLKMFKI